MQNEILDSASKFSYEVKSLVPDWNSSLLTIVVLFEFGCPAVESGAYFSNGLGTITGTRTGEDSLRSVPAVFVI